jgi:hypothetical protein
VLGGMQGECVCASLVLCCPWAMPCYCIALRCCVMLCAAAHCALVRTTNTARCTVHHHADACTYELCVGVCAVVCSALRPQSDSAALPPAVEAALSRCRATVCSYLFWPELPEHDLQLPQELSTALEVSLACSRFFLAYSYSIARILLLHSSATWRGGVKREGGAVKCQRYSCAVHLPVRA